MLAQLLADTRGCTRVIAPALASVPTPAPEAADPIVLALRAENALSDLLTALQGDEDGAPDVDFAELLTRLELIAGRTADVAEQVCDMVENVDGASFETAHERTAAAVPGLRSSAAHFEVAAGHAEDGQDELAA
ncbi:hypothetical protein ABT352_33110 [Streptosporangium sp. NPDC000563]|uniref:hypothetical protein n=1 Tax=Streptosporangium sp. NPDC000563 TaxID=3154366 RepID=UPI003329476E